MAYIVQKASLKVKIYQFQQANVNFSTKLEELRNFLKFYPIEAIEEYIAKPSSLLIKVKWLILINTIIIDSKCESLEAIDKCLSILNLSKDKSTNSFDLLIYEKLVNPYKLYLQKRNLHNSPNSNENEVYQLINLIRTALSFTDIIFTIGRYLYKDNKFLSQFIITMGKDLSNLYKRMKEKLTQEMMMRQADVIEKMNEGLYNIFYNCYFSQLVSRLAPIWINTETLFKKIAAKEGCERLSPSKCSKQVQETIILEKEFEFKENSVIELQQLTYEPKSTSTIESNNDKDNKETEDEERRQFLQLAQTLLQEFEKIESCQRIIY